jgi:ubiquitin-like-conjugating enzyme ATG10
MEFKNFPSLDADEFAELCHFLDRRYRQATLGPLRRRWRLRICEALAGTFMSETGSSTYIQIIRPLEATLDHGNLSEEIEKFSFGNGQASTDQDMADLEDADQVRTLHRSSQPQNSQLTVPQDAIRRDGPVDMGRVVYEIHFHPTYRMPCLWFTLHDLPASEPSFDIDTVLRRLVPDQFKEAMRGQGIGGISSDVSCCHESGQLCILINPPPPISLTNTMAAAPPSHWRAFFLYPSVPPWRRHIKFRMHQGKLFDHVDRSRWRVCRLMGAQGDGRGLAAVHCNYSSSLSSSMATSPSSLSSSDDSYLGRFVPRLPGVLTSSATCSVAWGLDGSPAGLEPVAAALPGAGALKMLCWRSVTSTSAAPMDEFGILKVPSSLATKCDLDLAYWIFWGGL